MMTISRLIAAILFAAAAFLTGEAFRPVMPEGTQFGYYDLICAGIGLACGWMVMGRLVGRGYRAAIGFGLQTAVTVVAWALLVFSIILMVRKAFKNRYDGPMEAIVDIFTLAMEHGLMMLTPEVLSTLVFGGIVGGLGAEWAKQRWD